MSEAVNVTIIEKCECVYPQLPRFEVTIRMSSEFAMEPRGKLPLDQKIEYIAQRIKEEFIKKLTKDG